MPFREKAAHCLGCFSLVLSVVPVIYVTHAELFPDTSFTEESVLVGGIGGSLLTALGAGFMGSRWWFLATLGCLADLVCIFLFSP